MHQIGVGVLGPVFRTFDPSEDRLAAVKAFHLDLTPEQAAAFVESLTELVSIGLSHPAIVAPIAAGIEDGVPYLAQEYVAAESLDVAMRQDAPAAADTALRFITQVGEAIDAAHERGVAHGALHLRDIFVTPEEARTTGFGIVHALERVGLRGPIRRPYTAPELIAGRRWAGEADRFALASIAYELLTGKRAAGSGEQVTERLDTIPDVADRGALRHVFETALADAPESRYASAVDLAVALRTAMGVEVDPDAFAGHLAPTGESMSAVRVAGGGEETISDLLANLDLHPAEDVSSSPAPAAARMPEPLEQTPPVDAGRPADVAGTEPDPPAQPGFEGELGQSQRSDAADLDPLEPTLPLAAAGDDVEELVVWDAVDPDPTVETDETGDPTLAAPRFDLPAFDDAAAREPSIETVTAAADAEHDTFEQPILGALDTDVGSDIGDPYGMADDELDIEPASPWSPRAIAPIVLAMAVGTLAAYVVWLGIGSRGDETVTDAGPMAVTVPEADRASVGDESAGSVSTLADEASQNESGQEWSEATVAAAGDAGDESENLADARRPTPLGVPSAPAATELTADAVAAARADRRGAGTTATVPVEPTPESRRPTARAAPLSVSARRASARPAPAETGGSGWLLVRTNPPGATVRVDGVNRGRTPLSLQDVAFGSHEVAISQAGFEGRTREVDLSVDAAVAAVSVDLVPDRSTGTTAAAGTGTGSLLVDSRPPGARVLVDGRAAGTTPVLVPDLAFGSHRVQIEREGYQTWTTMVALSSGERVRVAASLEGGSPR